MKQVSKDDTIAERIVQQEKMTTKEVCKKTAEMRRACNFLNEKWSDIRFKDAKKAQEKNV